jgi:hypothetical protein
MKPAAFRDNLQKGFMHVEFPGLLQKHRVFENEDPDQIPRTNKFLLYHNLIGCGYIVVKTSYSQQIISRTY